MLQRLSFRSAVDVIVFFGNRRKTGGGDNYFSYNVFVCDSFSIRHKHLEDVCSALQSDLRKTDILRKYRAKVENTKKRIQKTISMLIDEIAKKENRLNPGLRHIKE